MIILNNNYNYLPMKKKKKEFWLTLHNHLQNHYIFKYYPYGSTLKLDGPFGTDDLSNITNEAYDKLNEHELVNKILKETSRAVHYLSRELMSSETIDEKSGWYRQYLDSMTLYELFTDGKQGWSTKAIDRLNEQEADELELLHRKKIDEIRGEINTDPFKFEREYYKEHPEAKIEKRQKHGIYFVEVYPLKQTCSHNPKIFYTKQQLKAIAWLVDEAFENLC